MSIDTLRQWAPMFADHAQNLHDLPGDVLKTHQAVIRLDAQITSTASDRPDPTATTRDVVAATKAAALAGKAWPGVMTIREAADAVADHDLRRQTLDRARQEMAGELSDLIVNGAEIILVDYLRPAFDRLVAAFEAAASVLPEAPTTDALLRAPDKVRKTWLSLDDDVNKHTRIMSTALRLNRLNPPGHDTEGEFFSLTNVRDAWPDYRPGVSPPWENVDPRLTRLSIIRAGGKMWLPTSSERDAAWQAAHGAKVEQARNNRFALEGFRAIGGSA